MNEGALPGYFGEFQDPDEDDLGVKLDVIWKLIDYLKEDDRDALYYDQPMVSR